MNISGLLISEAEHDFTVSEFEWEFYDSKIK